MSKLENETVVIKNDKIYTSYYARACKIIPDRRLVAISRGIPDNFGGSTFRELNPSQDLLFSYKQGIINEQEYEERYNVETLSKLNPLDIYNKLKGKVLLCYCGKDKFCHRQLVIKWLETHLGTEVIGGEV
jgi:uncharacterized protein YeaO (DUF488 family)